MKKFKNKVRWNFKFSMHGYGKNVKEALHDSLQNALWELEDGQFKDSFSAIEEYEVVSIDQNDIEEK